MCVKSTPIYDALATGKTEKPTSVNNSNYSQSGQFHKHVP